MRFLAQCWEAHILLHIHAKTLRPKTGESMYYNGMHKQVHDSKPLHPTVEGQLYDWYFGQEYHLSLFACVFMYML